MMATRIPEVWQNWVAASDLDPCARKYMAALLLLHWL
jgi:hypothetical protein